MTIGSFSICISSVWLSVPAFTTGEYVDAAGGPYSEHFVTWLLATRSVKHSALVAGEVSYVTDWNSEAYCRYCKWYWRNMWQPNPLAIGLHDVWESSLLVDISIRLSLHMHYSSYMVVEYYWNGKSASLYEVPTPEWGHVEMANAAIYIRYIFFRRCSPQMASSSLKNQSEQHWISEDQHFLFYFEKSNLWKHS